MEENIITISKSILALVVAFISFFLSKLRYSENVIYAEQHSNCNSKLILRLIFTLIIKYLSIIIIFLILTQKINYFIAFYILTPILIAVNIVFFKNKELIMGGMTLIKGIYYIGVIIISLIQYLCESSYATELALGFTLSLAIFESITAISDGYSKLESAKNKL